MEYHILTYSGKIRLKSAFYDKENGKIIINKIRLYYFFSRERKGLLKYIKNDGVISTI